MKPQQRIVGDRLKSWHGNGLYHPAYPQWARTNAARSMSILFHIETMTVAGFSRAIFIGLVDVRRSGCGEGDWHWACSILEIGGETNRYKDIESCWKLRSYLLYSSESSLGCSVGEAPVLLVPVLLYVLKLEPRGGAGDLPDGDGGDDCGGGAAACAG